MLPADYVRWVSLALSIGFLVAARPRAKLLRRNAPAPRATRPLDAVTGPLWVALHVLSPCAFFLEVLVPGWVYEGPRTLRFVADAPLQILGLAA